MPSLPELRDLQDNDLLRNIVSRLTALEDDTYNDSLCTVSYVQVSINAVGHPSLSMLSQSHQAARPASHPKPLNMLTSHVVLLQ